MALGVHGSSSRLLGSSCSIRTEFVGAWGEAELGAGGGGRDKGRYGCAGSSAFPLGLGFRGCLSLADLAVLEKGVGTGRGTSCCRVPGCSERGRRDTTAALSALEDACDQSLETQIRAAGSARPARKTKGNTGLQKQDPSSTTAGAPTRPHLPRQRALSPLTGGSGALASGLPAAEEGGFFPGLPSRAKPKQKEKLPSCPWAFSP